MTSPWQDAGLSRAVYYRQLQDAERATNLRRRDADKPKSLTKKQRDAWTEINQTIFDNAGSVVSKPMEEPLRFECDVNSDLPEVLRYCGYAVVPQGTNERLWPSMVDGITVVIPTTVAVWLLRLLSVNDVMRR